MKLFLVLFCFLSCFGCSQSYQNVPLPLGEKKVENVSSTPSENQDLLRPKTVSEAVKILLERMSLENQEKIRNTPREDLILYHHGWGTGIRNDFGLWGKNFELLKDTGEQHPDNASMVIIEAVWEALQEKK